VPVLSEGRENLILIVPGQPEYELAPGEDRLFTITNAPASALNSW